MAITIIGGLALGTLVTLGLIPILYWLLFDRFDRSSLRKAVSSPAGPPQS